jgi:hypothetical protein
MDSVEVLVMVGISLLILAGFCVAVIYIILSIGKEDTGKDNKK